MRRGEIRLVDLGPVADRTGTRRPAVIVSNDRANAAADRLGRGQLIVVPLSSNVAQVLPFQTRLPGVATGLRVDAKAQAEQVRSVGVDQIGPALGRVPAELMSELDDALRLHLHL